MKPFLLLLGLLPLLCAGASAQNAPDGFDISKWRAGGVSLEAAPDGRTRVTFSPGDWPHARFISPTPLDWTGQSLQFQTFNPGKAPLEFHVRLDDDVNADGWKGCRTAQMTALPGKTQRWIIAPDSDPMAMGMRALPPLAAPDGATVVTATGAAPLNTKHIVAWQVFVSHPPEKVALDIGDIKLSPAPTNNLSGIVDEFGQYARADWPGKIHSLAELQSAREREERELLARPQLAGRDLFGGDANSPKLAATGFFRTQKEGERWWLVTPQGRKFWSAGVDVVQRGQPTITTARETMFTFLPRAGDPLAKFIGRNDFVLMGPQKGKTVETFDPYGANLQRKYGDNWNARWEQTALARLRSWGFNSVGNWSDSALWAPALGEARLPFTATVSIWGEHAKVSAPGQYWGAMHDPFDPKFAVNCEARLSEAATNIKTDPLCIGYFVDNELAWGDPDLANPRAHYALSIGTLGSGADSPAKAAFVADLKKKYTAIEALNTAWNTKIASWAELSAPFTVPDVPNDALKADLSAFLTHFADRYFQTVRDCVRKADANHLYLGCRFAWRTPEAVQSAAKWCDVVSFNIYAKRLDEKEWGFVKGLNKPAIIGEFHMGSLDRGLFHPGLIATKDQTERAQMFGDYLQSVAQNPVFVGAHWFQYTDEALTGRPFDGENYNIGMVSVADVPYAELVASARTANANVYRWHNGK